MSSRGTLRLATRGSALARQQAAEVKAALEDRRYTVEIVEVETTGDQIRDELIHRLGKTGAFVRSLDEEVLTGAVDGAIHSMKDMPTDQPEDLVVAGIPERATAADVLVTPDGVALDDLPDGAVVGTASLRRTAQLRRQRPDLTVEPIRGNVDTRVAKLLAPRLQREHQRRLEAEEETPAEEENDEAPSGDADADGAGDETFDRTPGEWFDDLAEIERRALGRQVDWEYDAIVLAAAGLERSGLDREVPTVTLPTGQFVPAPGQGALAVTALDGSDASEAIHDVIDHPRTRVETTVERVILAQLGGGCIAPIGVYAVVRGEHVHVDVQVLDRDGADAVIGSRDLPIQRYVPAARELADDLADRGAADLIAAAKREFDDDQTEPEPREETEE